MPAQTTITIKDGKATPVDHNFSPNGALATPDKKVISDWIDRSATYRLGQPTIREQHAVPNATGLEKIRFVIEVPKLKMEGGVDTPIRSHANTAVVEVWIHDNASAAELADLAAYVKNFTATAYFKQKVETRERTW